MLCAVAAYGCSQVQIDFSTQFFINEGVYVYDFFELNDEYFKSGFQATTFVDNPNIDYSSRESQLQMRNFNEKLQRCEGCSEQWNKENTLSSWYDQLYNWVNSGECPA